MADAPPAQKGSPYATTGPRAKIMRKRQAREKRQREKRDRLERQHAENEARLVGEQQRRMAEDFSVFPDFTSPSRFPRGSQITTENLPSLLTAALDKPEKTKLQEDEGIIKCICNFAHGDGAMIFCEKCNTWQHIACYYYLPGEAEKVKQEDFDHSCADCNPRVLNMYQAMERQSQYTFSDGDQFFDASRLETQTSATSPVPMLHFKSETLESVASKDRLEATNISDYNTSAASAASAEFQSLDITPLLNHPSKSFDAREGHGGKKATVTIKDAKGNPVQQERLKHKFAPTRLFEAPPPAVNVWQQRAAAAKARQPSMTAARASSNMTTKANKSISGCDTKMDTRNVRPTGTFTPATSENVPLRKGSRSWDETQRRVQRQRHWDLEAGGSLRATSMQPDLGREEYNRRDIFGNHFENMAAPPLPPELVQHPPKRDKRPISPPEKTRLNPKSPQTAHHPLGHYAQVEMGLGGSSRAYEQSVYGEPLPHTRIDTPRGWAHEQHNDSGMLSPSGMRPKEALRLEIPPVQSSQWSTIVASPEEMEGMGFPEAPWADHAVFREAEDQQMTPQFPSTTHIRTATGFAQYGSPQRDEHEEFPPSAAEIREQKSDAPCQEGTVADSGYVSACVSRSINDPKSHEELRKPGAMEQTEAQSPVSVDQQTEYTSSVLPHGSDYINDFCNDIHMKLKGDLQKHAHGQARIELPRCLPDLVKAFSIRIGLDTSEPSRAYVMHFLHTHSRDIVAAFEFFCQHREESPGLGPGNTGDEGMTVLDRMALWSRKENDDPALDSDKDCLFEGVRDMEEENIADNAKMAKHRDFVLSSPAYQWFIETLRKHLSLDWGPDDSAKANSCCLIHRSIMSNIPSGLISRHRTPDNHRARFRIKIHPNILHYLGSGPIGIFTTLTSSAPNVVQMSTVQDYLDQTWSSGGLNLAKLIQKACCGPTRATHTDILDNKTWVAAELEMPGHPDSVTLLVTAVGPRYSIAECGEQLAWLGAAIQAPASIGSPSMPSCTCTIESQYENELTLQYSLDHFLGTSRPKGAQTASKICDATIIQGFPTLKRPPLFQGLELGLARMLEFIGTSWSPVFENDRIFLKGSFHVLELVRHTQNILLWHYVHPGSTTCSFSECPSRNEHDAPSFHSGLRNEILALDNRHIIANLEYLGIPAVNPDSPIDKNMAQASAQTGIPSVEMREDFDTVLPPAEARSSAMDSSGDSLDSDMLSISSEDSDCGKALDIGGSLASIIDQISHRIFAEFKESRGLRSRPQWSSTRNHGTGDNSDDSANSSNPSVSCSAFQCNDIEVPQRRKRGRPNDEDEDWDDGGFRKPPRPTKRPVLSPNRSRARILACPFWKLDSQTNRACFRMKLSRIGDVKYHLNRKHKQPASEYCQRCWIAFENKAHKNSHLSDDSGQLCRYDPAARPAGIDNAMAVGLSKKSKRDQSIEDRWFAIWDIVFPDQPRPSSPYIDDSLTEDATQLQEIIVNRWPSILASILDEVGGSVAPTDTDRLAREHLIRETLARLSDDFSAEQARMRTASSSSSHQSPGGQTTTSSNRTDSAIETGSYQSNHHLSAGCSDETSRSMPGPSVPQIRTHSLARGQSSNMHTRGERLILPPDQNSFNVNYDQQQISMPPPKTSLRATFTAMPSVQKTDVYGAGDSFGTEITINDPFPPLIEDSAPRSFLENVQSDVYASLESMENLAEFDWSSN